MTRRFWRIFLLLSLLAGPGWPALAEGGPRVTRNQAVTGFPAGITFKLAAESDVEITRAVLHYSAEARSCLSSEAQQAVAIDPAPAIEAEWEWDFTRTGVLPPSVRFGWYWTITDAGGAETVTERQWDTITDPRFQWQVAARDGVTVTWTEGNRAFGEGLLDLSLDSLDALEQDLGVRPAGPVTLLVYPDSDHLTEAFLTLPEWTGGVALPQYNVVVTGIQPDQDAWAADVVPHELAHLVVGTLVFNCRGVGLPTWLNEGLAVNAEGPGSPDDAARVRQALLAGQLHTLRSMANGFQADTGRAVLAYAHSAEVVRFMLREYGRDKIGELLARVREGATIDPALEAVYGLNTDGLDSAWRVSEGAAPLPTAAPTLAPADRTAVPTLALWTAAPVTMVAATGAPVTSTPPAVAQAATATPTHVAPRPTTPTLAAPAGVSNNLPSAMGLVAGAACVLLLLLLVGGTLVFVLRKGRRP